MLMKLADVGAKLRMLRKRRGLKLREVADAVGVSVGYLSQLEAGKVGASFSTLLKLTHFYGENLADLLRALENPERPLVSRSGSRSSVIKSGQFTIEWLVAEPDCRMEVDIMTVEPKGASGGSYSHDGEEFCLVLDGTLRLMVGEEQYLLEKGDLVYFKSVLPHSWENPSDSEIARVLWCTTPPAV